ncbi:MAG: hypothetical protein JO193_09685, partial [Candidatus Eremiobacteraeota bacterium]|nr:hypothetical protein [Candidatus Eremiobacteraeota bacterium]
AASRSVHDVNIAPSSDIVAGIATLLALRGRDKAPSGEELAAATEKTRGASVFYAARAAKQNGASLKTGAPAALYDGRLFSGETLTDAARSALKGMGVQSGGLITLYYGGGQSERDAQRMRDELEACMPGTEVEYYFGGQPSQEYVISYDE